MVESLTAVVIGLGKVGSRFDEDPGRTVPWSHVGAYLALPEKFRLVGACDQDEGNRAAFARRCPNLPVSGDLAEILAQCRPDVVSVCTPTASHPAVVADVLRACPQIRGLWHEKPLAEDLAGAREIVRACRDHGTPTLISFNRRWMALWRRVRELIDQGAVGRVRCVRVAMPNRLYSIGSHAADLLLFLGGRPLSLSAHTIPALTEEGEPAVAGMVGFADGAYGILQVTGLKNRLVVEAEVIGDEGRITAREDHGQLQLERFVPSPRYGGYLDFGPASMEVPETEGFSAFVAMAEELYRLAAGDGPSTCDAEAALSTQVLLEMMATGAPSSLHPLET